MSAPRYRLILARDGVPASEGAQAAGHLTEEFKQRPWHQNVMCEWGGRELVLRAENDFDPDGRALKDEFSDAISAFVGRSFDGDIHVVSVECLNGK